MEHLLRLHQLMIAKVPNIRVCVNSGSRSYIYTNIYKKGNSLGLKPYAASMNPNSNATLSITKTHEIKPFPFPC